MDGPRLPRTACRSNPETRATLQRRTPVPVGRERTVGSDFASIGKRTDKYWKRSVSFFKDFRLISNRTPVVEQPSPSLPHSLNGVQWRRWFFDNGEKPIFFDTLIYVLIKVQE